MFHWRGRVTGGLIILIIGVIFLLRNLGIIQQPAWSVMWPTILIVIGLGTLIEGGIRVRIRRKKGE
ncbi:hypothetical protein KAW65_02320 [candidate division WOR-3 bacterium]|nr:hypothetical protein [candidate division WOR-3 bacterium]